MEMCTFHLAEQQRLFDANDGSQVICNCFEELDNVTWRNAAMAEENQAEKDEAIATNLVSFPSPPNPDLIIEAMDSVVQPDTTTTNSQTV